MTPEPSTVSRSSVRSLLARVAASVAVAGALLAGAVIAPGVGAAAASDDESNVNDFAFSWFEGEYTLGIDDEGRSTLRSVETFVAEFPDFDQNKGIIRAIPEGYLGVNLHTKIVSVTDADGNPVEYDDGEREDGFIQLALGTDDYVQGTQTYVIEYTQRDVVRVFADTNVDEFYWDSPGTGWRQAFLDAQVRVVVPEELTGALTGASACYQGEYGSDYRCELTERTENGATVFETARASINPRENYSLAIAFDKGTFVTPTIPSTWPVFTVVPAGIAAVGAGTLVGALIIRRKRTADAPGRGIIVPQYSVPKNLDIFVAADLIGKTAKAMPALLLSLAVRRNLRILDEGEEKGLLGKGKREYRLQFLTNDGASPADLTTLDALFGKKRKPGAIKELSATDEKLARKVQGLVAAAPRLSVEGGYRVTKKTGGRSFALVATVVMLSLIGLLIAAAAMYGINAWVAISAVVGLATAICTYIAVTSRNALTPKGVEVRDYLLGLRDYLALAEADRIAMLQSPSGAERVAVEDAVDPRNTMQMVTFYEKLLPFAVLWGIEKEWTAELARYYEQAGSNPDWYTGSTGFHAAQFTSGLGTFSTSSGSSTPWSASATASTSGGSSGGGFSGGGGGGGGGGGR